MSLDISTAVDILARVPGRTGDVTAALMHEPSDSSLLWNAVRVMMRLLRERVGEPGPVSADAITLGVAKQRAREIQSKNLLTFSSS